MELNDRDMRFPDEKVTILWRATYLAMIKNSVGTKLFRNCYAVANGKKQDILRNGDLSCAIYVSTILTICQLLDRPRTTVASTEAALKQCGWKRIDKPRAGAVIVWESRRGISGEQHFHIGFSLGGYQAVSNNSERGYPIIHHFTFGAVRGRPKRRIKSLYWNHKLNVPTGAG